MHSRGLNDDTSKCRVFAPYSCPLSNFVGTGRIEIASLQSFVDRLESWIEQDKKLRFATKVLVLQVLKDALCDASPTPTRQSVDLVSDTGKVRDYPGTCGEETNQRTSTVSDGNARSKDAPEVTFSQSIRRYFGRTHAVNATSTIRDHSATVPQALALPSRGIPSVIGVDLRPDIPSGVRLRLCDGFQVLHLLTYMYMSDPHRMRFGRVTRVYSRTIPFNFSFDEILLLGGIDPSTYFFPCQPRVETWRDSIFMLEVLANDVSGLSKAFARLREGVICYLRIYQSMVDTPLEKPLPSRNSPDIALTEAFRKLAVNLRMMQHPNGWYP